MIDKRNSIQLDEIETCSPNYDEPLGYLYLYYSITSVSLTYIILQNNYFPFSKSYNKFREIIYHLTF